MLAHLKTGSQILPVKRNVENFVALVEHVLDAVAMVNIPVEDQYSVQALFSHLGQVSQVNINSKYFFQRENLTARSAAMATLLKRQKP